MSHSSLSKILKTITIILMLGFVVFMAVVVPIAGKRWAFMGDGKNVFLPWAVMIWVAAVPCVIALVLFWQICNEISRDNSFSEINAVKMKKISFCAFFDAIFFAAGNVIYLIMNMNSILVFGLSLIVCMIGGAVGIAAAILSRLITKAAVMKQENELTI